MLSSCVNFVRSMTNWQTTIKHYVKNCSRSTLWVLHSCVSDPVICTVHSLYSYVYWWPRLAVGTWAWMLNIYLKVFCMLVHSTMLSPNFEDSKMTQCTAQNYLQATETYWRLVIGPILPDLDLLFSLNANTEMLLIKMNFRSFYLSHTIYFY